MSLRWKIAQFFEALWWKVYLLRKKPEAYLEWKRNYWLNFLKTVPGIIHERERILEVGCGPAGIYTVLARNQVVALDPLLPTYRRFTHFRGDESGNITFIETRFEDYHFENLFDRIFCLNVINHVDDVDLSFAQLNKGLAVKGILHLSVDAHRAQSTKKLFQLVPGDILHPHQFELEDYLEKLKHACFEIVKTDLIKSGFIFNYYLITATKKSDVYG